MNNDDFLSLEEHSEPAGQGADETILEETNPGSGQPRFSVFAGLQSVFIVAFLIASLFTLFTPNNLFFRRNPRAHLPGLAGKPYHGCPSACQ